eukprot:gene53478-1565_t
MEAEQGAQQLPPPRLLVFVFHRGAALALLAPQLHL